MALPCYLVQRDAKRHSKCAVFIVIKFFKLPILREKLKKKKKNQKEKTPTPSFLFPFPSLHGLLNEKASTNAPSPQATPYLATI